MSKIFRRLQKRPMQKLVVSGLITEKSNKPRVRLQMMSWYSNYSSVVFLFQVNNLLQSPIFRDFSMWFRNMWMLYDLSVTYRISSQSSSILIIYYSSSQYCFSYYIIQDAGEGQCSCCSYYMDIAGGQDPIQNRLHPQVITTEWWRGAVQRYQKDLSISSLNSSLFLLMPVRSNSRSLKVSVYAALFLFLRYWKYSHTSAIMQTSLSPTLRLLDSDILSNSVVKQLVSLQIRVGNKARIKYRLQTLLAFILNNTSVSQSKVLWLDLTKKSLQRCSTVRVSLNVQQSNASPNTMLLPSAPTVFLQISKIFLYMRLMEVVMYILSMLMYFLELLMNSQMDLELRRWELSSAAWTSNQSFRIKLISLVSKVVSLKALIILSVFTLQKSNLEGLLKQWQTSLGSYPKLKIHNCTSCLQMSLSLGFLSQSTPQTYSWTEIGLWYQTQIVSFFQTKDNIDCLAERGICSSLGFLTLNQNTEPRSLNLILPNCSTLRETPVMKACCLQTIQICLVILATLTSWNCSLECYLQSTAFWAPTSYLRNPDWAKFLLQVSILSSIRCSSRTTRLDSFLSSQDFIQMKPSAWTPTMVNFCSEASSSQLMILQSSVLKLQFCIRTLMFFYPYIQTMAKLPLDGLLESRRKIHAITDISLEEQSYLTLTIQPPNDSMLMLLSLLPNLMFWLRDTLSSSSLTTRLEPSLKERKQRSDLEDTMMELMGSLCQGRAILCCQQSSPYMLNFYWDRTPSTSQKKQVQTEWIWLYLMVKSLICLVLLILWSRVSWGLRDIYSQSNQQSLTSFPTRTINLLLWDGTHWNLDVTSPLVLMAQLYLLYSRLVWPVTMTLNCPFPRTPRQFPVPSGNLASIISKATFIFLPDSQPSSPQTQLNLLAFSFLLQDFLSLLS